MYYDRFDIAEAYYVFFSHYHCGQGCKLYERLSKLLNYFSPRLTLSGRESLNENAKEIYDQLVWKDLQNHQC